MRTCIRGGMIITPDHTLDDAVVIIENGKVAAIEARLEVAAEPLEIEMIDADGLLVLPEPMPSVSQASPMVSTTWAASQSAYGRAWRAPPLVVWQAAH